MLFKRLTATDPERVPQISTGRSLKHGSLPVGVPLPLTPEGWIVLGSIPRTLHILLFRRYFRSTLLIGATEAN